MVFIFVNKVFYFEDEEFKTYSTDYYSKSIVDLVSVVKPEILLIGATNQGRDLAPRVASALHAGLTADCTGLDINEKGCNSSNFWWSVNGNNFI